MSKNPSITSRYPMDGHFHGQTRPSQSDPVCANYDGDGQNSHRGFKKMTKSDMTVAQSTFYTVCG